MLGQVVITGANGQVGQLLCRALGHLSESTIALVRRPILLPVSEVIPDWLNSPQAWSAIANADAVIHLAGSLKPKSGDYIAANVQTTKTLTAALRTQTKRIIFLSYLGASLTATNPYLRTKAESEEILRATGIPLTIFRCSHIIGPPHKPGPTANSLISQNDHSVTVLGSGNNQVAPIFIDDVVWAIQAALRVPDNSTFDLVGLETYTINDLVYLLNRKELKITHLPQPIAKLLAWIVPGLPSALVDVMLADSLGNPEPVIQALNLQLTSLRQVWEHQRIQA